MYELIFMLIALVVLAIQVVFCLKYNKTWFKFIPLGICVLITIGLFAAGMIVKDGWTGAGLWILGVLSLLSITACGLGCFIAAFIKKFNSVPTKH